MKKLFIDSDVMLDVSLQRKPFDLPALNLFELCHEEKVEAVTSSVAFINTNYFLRKLAPANRLQTLKRLREVVKIINVSEDIIDKALYSTFADFEDAVQFYAAKNAGVDTIITRNIKDYKDATLPVLTPEQFLNTL